MGKHTLGSLHNSSTPIAKRFAEFCDFIDSDQIEGSKDEFFSTNPDSIFAMLSEEYNFREPYFQKGKYIGKLNKILDVLKKLITNNSEKIRRDLWQLRNIVLIIASCTHHSVQHSVRKEGLIILQLMIECFICDIPDDLICLLVNAVDFSPYQISYPLPEPFFDQSKSYMQIAIADCIFPATVRTNEETKKEESLELLQMIFSFLENVPLERFQIWLDAIKMTYFSLFYPLPCQEMKIVSSGDFGFSTCPADIQKIVIQSLMQWSRSPIFHQLLPILLDNLPLLLEISRQACLLELQFSDTIEKSIKLFKAWFLDANVMSGKDEQVCWQSFMANVSLFFMNSSKAAVSEDQRAKHHEISLKSLQIYVFFAVEFYSAMTEHTWHLLQNTFLNISIELSHRSSYEPIQEPLFRVLYLIWVRSPYSTTEMWRDFSSKISWLINKKSAVDMWITSLTQLTYTMRNLYYPAAAKETHIKLDPYYTSVPWTKKTIVATWQALFKIFEDFNRAQGLIYELFMRLLHDVSQILLAAEAQYPETENPVSIYTFILPILAAAISQTGGVFHTTPRVVLAYKTFCAIFVVSLNVINIKYPHFVNKPNIASPTNDNNTPRINKDSTPMDTHTPSQQVDDNIETPNKSNLNFKAILCDLYAIVAKGLATSNNAIIYEVLPSCTQIFTLQLPEGYRLIHAVMGAILNLLVDNGFRGVPRTVKVSALKIASSLICFPSSLVNREQLSKFLTHVLLSNLDDEDLILCTIYSNCTLAFHELHEPAPRKDEVGIIIAGILQFTADPRDSVAEAALDSLSTLSLVYPAIDALRIHAFALVLKRLATNTDTLIEDGIAQRKIRDCIISRHFSCLLDWLVADGKLDVLKSDQSLSMSILNVAELALSCALLGSEASIDAVHDAADFFIEQLVLLHCAIDSTIKDTEDDITVPSTATPGEPTPAIHFSFQQNVIWSFSDAEEGKVRLTVRKPTRKIDFELPYDVKISEIEAGSTMMDGDLEAENNYFTTKLERFLNKLFSAQPQTFNNIVGYQLPTSEYLEYSKTQKKRKSFLSVIKNPPPKKISSQSDISAQCIVPKSCSAADFSYMRDTSSEKFARMLREIDRMWPSLVSKIGVIYVGPGQTAQGDILANEIGSATYEKFIKGLGEKIDLTTHIGYNGGLDTVGYTSGKVAIFHCTPAEEIIFHIATMMPTVIGDRIQLNKKKHIGNDFVHVVWCESTNEYNRGTIGGQFNDVHIIVYPQASGLYRIAVHRKASGERTIPFFGPVLDGMVLSGNILPLLLRQTAVFANRNCRKLSKGYTTPYHARDTLIKEAIEKTRAVSPQVYEETTKVQQEGSKTIGPVKIYDTGSGKLRKSVSMETFVITDKRLAGARNSVRLRHSSDATNNSTKDSDGKTPRSLVNLFGPRHDTFRPDTANSENCITPGNTKKETNIDIDLKNDDNIEGIHLPSSNNINININININNTSTTQTTSPSLSLSFIVPPDSNNINFNNNQPNANTNTNTNTNANANANANTTTTTTTTTNTTTNTTTTRFRARRSNSTVERKSDLPKFPSSPDFIRRDTIPPDDPHTSTGTSIRTFLASLSKHVSSNDEQKSARRKNIDSGGSTPNNSRGNSLNSIPSVSSYSNDSTNNGINSPCDILRSTNTSNTSNNSTANIAATIANTIASSTSTTSSSNVSNARLRSFSTSITTTSPRSPDADTFTTTNPLPLRNNPGLGKHSLSSGNFAQKRENSGESENESEGNRSSHKSPPRSPPQRAATFSLNSKSDHAYHTARSPPLSPISALPTAPTSPTTSPTLSSKSLPRRSTFSISPNKNLNDASDSDSVKEIKKKRSSLHETTKSNKNKDKESVKNNKNKEGNKNNKSSKTNAQPDANLSPLSPNTNKRGSFPTINKSKSFLRSIVQKWNLSSKPPSYPPPPIPEDYSEDSTQSSETE